VTEIICYILRPGEARPAATKPVEPRAATGNSKVAAPATESAAESAEQYISPLARRIAQAANLDLGNIQGTGPGKRIMRRDVESTLSASQPISKPRATPAARRLAREAGLDLSEMSGTGPRGRIQVDNVVEEIKEAAEEANFPLTPAPSPRKEGKGEMRGSSALHAQTGEVVYGPRIVKLEGMRRTIAQRLQQSYQTAPHFF